MQLNTASAVITFVTKHEEETKKFYEKLAQKHPEGKEFFLTYTKENKRNKVMVERTYYESSLMHLKPASPLKTD